MNNARRILPDDQAIVGTDRELIGKAHDPQLRHLFARQHGVGAIGEEHIRPTLLHHQP
jgi:hypothetical protein